MKKLVFLFSLAFGSILGFAQTRSGSQDTWTIKWNKKTLLQASKEDESANTKKIKQTDLSKNYCLEISYREADPAREKTWNRAFMFFGDTDTELLRKDSTRSTTITAEELRKLFGDQKKIRIYTVAIPSDPELAARIRVRRVHMATIELQ